MMVSALGKNTNFKLHGAGVALSHAGNFFTLVAWPWLALAISGNDPIVVSTLVATCSLPQGLSFLFGGGLADRFSPYRSLLVIRTAFGLSLIALASCTYAGLTPLWLMYVFAFATGVLAAAATPASQALLPAIVAPEALGKANSILMATLQAAQLAAPIAAGWLIWLGKRIHGVGENEADLRSLSFAFAVEAVAVFSAAGLMLFMQPLRQARTEGRLAGLIGEGLRFCWRDEGIRLVLTYLLVVSFFLQGPLLSGLPLFTRFNLGLSERAYGALYAMIGAGTILGAGLAVWTKPSDRRLGAVVLVCDLAIGLSLHLLSRATNAWWAGACLAAIGTGLGMTAVAGTTWFHRRTPSRYMGRVMSLLMFSIFGLVPISAAATGFLVSNYSVSRVLGAAGVAIFLFAGAGLLVRRVREMGALPVGSPEPTPLENNELQLAALNLPAAGK